MLALDVKGWDDDIRKSFRHCPIIAVFVKQLIQVSGIVPGPDQIVAGPQKLFEGRPAVTFPEIAYGEICELF